MTQTRKLAGKEAEIIQATVMGESVRHIASQVGVSSSTVQRERDRLQSLIAEARDTQSMRTQEAIVETIKGLLEVTYDVVQNAKDEGDHKTIVQAVKTALDCTMRAAEIQGLAKPSNSVTVNVGVNTLVQQIVPTEAELRFILEIREIEALPEREQLRRMRDDADAYEAKLIAEGK